MHHERARQAHALGLVNAVLPPPEVLPHALNVARKLGEKAPSALRHAKALLKLSATQSVQERMRVEGDIFKAQLQSPEVAEAIGDPAPQGRGVAGGADVVAETPERLMLRTFSTTASVTGEK